MKTLVWLREDLRLFDNPALFKAASQGDVIPVFYLPTNLGGASRWWLHHSLQALSDALLEQGVNLILRQGDPAIEIPKLAKECGAEQVYWNRVYSPLGIALGQTLKQNLTAADIKCTSYNGQLLIEPSKILNKQGTPFKVFTPFWRHYLTQLEPQVLFDVPSFSNVANSDRPSKLASDDLQSWNLLPTKPNWADGLAQRWQAGEQGAQQRWSVFLEKGIDNYKEGRDFPNKANTSYLSPHLAFGEISPSQLYNDINQAIADHSIDSTNGSKFLAEIGWREYSRYLLVHFPHITEKPFNQRFTDFAWQDPPQLISAWQRGQTGYPIVDAGMRELWHTGYMHNRVRMVVASFLTKHCLAHWQHGVDWFNDTLVDADIANNTASWQWVAGCGADASPYFRIFNPVLQGEKFDKQGDYVRQWVPELANLPNKVLHQPWTADAAVLKQAKVTLGVDYPQPIVDHKQARELALSFYQEMKLQS